MKISNTYKIHITICLLLLLPLAIFSQTTLKTKLSGKSSLAEIMKVVDEHYAGKPAGWRGYNEELPTLKHWKRWEWYYSDRLGPQAEFVNINKKNMMAYNQTAGSTRTINKFWTFLGPASIDTFGLGRADRIAFHPTDPNTYYVGSSGGGLWKTMDDGVRWTPLTDFIASLGISGVAVSWANPNVIYILTGDGDSDFFGGLVAQFSYQRKSQGVFRSNDAGATWFQTSPLDTMDYRPLKMVMNPTDANVLLVATTEGLYRTANGGNAWTKVKDGEFHDVEFKPGANRAYAAGRSQLLYSGDGGQTWLSSSLDSTITNNVRLELAVTPAKPSNVYLLAADSDTISGNFAGFYKSIDNGVTYKEMSNSPNILGKNANDNYQQARYSHSMAVSPVDTNKVVTGAVFTYRSNNGGNSWLTSTGPHADHHMLAFNPLNGNLYSCDDGGIYKSTDNGSSWTSLVNKFEASQVYHLAGTSANPDFLLAGLQDNGVIQQTINNPDFDQVLFVDGFMLAYAPNTTDTMYVGGNRELYRSRNGGIDLDSITPLGPADKEFFGNVLTHITDKSIVFAGFSKVFKSSNQGTTWTNTGASGNWAMANCPSNSNRIYSAGSPTYTPNESGKLWRSDDLGTTWDSLHTNPGFPPITNSTKITDIGVDPTNDSRVYVTFAGYTEGIKVYRSFFAGAGWENWSGSLPNVPILSIVVTSSSDVYIGTDIGVFYRTQAMDDWMPYKNGLPNAPVTDLVLDQPNSKIHCATFGRGIWTNSLVESCPLFLTISGAQSGYRFWQATDYINSTAQIVGTENATVHFQAGNHVLLMPGFTAERTSTFSARIRPCGAGGIPVTDETDKPK